MLEVSFLAFFSFELGNEIVSSLFSIVKKLLELFDDIQTFLRFERRCFTQ